MQPRSLAFKRLGAAALFGTVPLAGCAPVAVVPARPAVVVAPVPPAVAVAPALPVVAVVPAPTVVALPRAGEPLKKFKADEDTCRIYANEMIGNVDGWLPPPLQMHYDVAYSRCMSSRGYTVEAQGASAPVMTYAPAPPAVAVVPMLPPRPRVILVP